MLTGIVTVIGGVGLFLLGMTILTDGLKGLAGGALRRALAHFTRSPLSGAITGAVTTAIIQSSSVTTLAAIGFVGAGLLTFPQALGVVFGANIGTSVTGWLVALLGFKLSLDKLFLPAVFFGVVLRLFGPPRIRHAGWAVAGFGLLFVGIGVLQQGMAVFEGFVTPAAFPADSVWGRLQLVLIGAAITVVTQSSSAGVATALTAMSAGAISFPQAAAMVIGMDVGTTFKAVIAVIGASTAMRRTAYAHLVYNLMAATIAFFLLTPYAAFMDRWLLHGDDTQAQFALVGFHTLFNTIGVALIIGFTGQFARLIEWMTPERGPRLVEGLDPRLHEDPAAAADAAAAAIRDMASAALSLVANLLRRKGVSPLAPADIETLAGAHALALQFVYRIRTDAAQPLAHRRHLAAMHALDHIDRLIDRCRQSARMETASDEPRLQLLAERLRDLCLAVSGSVDADESVLAADDLRRFLRNERHAYRQQTLMEASKGDIDTQTALERLDAMRWLHRVAYHVWRILHHLEIARTETVEAPMQSEPPPPE